MRGGITLAVVGRDGAATSSSALGFALDPAFGARPEARASQGLPVSGIGAVR